MFRALGSRAVIATWLITPWFVVGCTGPIFRPQSPEAALSALPIEDIRLISDYTYAYGMDFMKIEAIGLATGLNGTGEDPPPTPQRAALLDEMKRRDVKNPAQILASPDTALVLMRGFLRPGIQEGDRFDIEVRVPSRSDATSLRGGWVLPARLTEMAVLGQQIRQGHLLALGEGSILVDPSADPKEEEALATRGRILGGGVALKSRPLGLIINNPYQSIRRSQQIGKAINDRFFTYVHGTRRGVATPKTDEFVELIVHPRYKDNVARYMRVVQNIAPVESPTERQARLVLLEHQMMDPLTASTAALRLEAIGNEEAVEILSQGIEAADPEVRFYSAEALAYLDKTAAVEPLANAARNEPALRVNALAALSAMDDVIAYDALRSLLDSKSAETRYGAFRALWAMNEYDPLVRGEDLEGRFTLHVLDVTEPAMIHVTRSYRPEVVLFGKEQRFQLPLVLDAGTNILVNGMSGDQITVSKFSPGSEPEQRVVSTRIDEVIRAIVDLGGTYPDVVQALQQAKRDGALASRFRVDALPETGREYVRNPQPASEESEPVQESIVPEVASPLPNLFSRKG